MIVLDTTTAGIQKFRMVDPNIILTELYGYPIEYISNTNIGDLTKMTNEKILCHISVVQNQNLVDLLRKKQNEGVKIIVDVDDYWEVPRTHYLYLYIKSNKIIEKTLDFLTKADFVLTTTKYLAKEIYKYNKKVAILPNSLNPSEGQLQYKPIANKKTRVGWVGGASHLEDLSLIKNLGVFTKLKERNLQFLLAGFDIRLRNEKGEIKEDFYKSVSKIYEEIVTNNYINISPDYKKFLFQLDRHLKYHNETNEPYRRIWTKPANKYLKIYNEIDIVIIPLMKNKFNGFKSELKLIEAGFFKKPVICSNIQQYSDVVSHGENGFLVEEKRAHKDFTKFLKILVDTPGLQKEMGAKLYEYCNKKFNLIKNSAKRLEIYESI